MRSILVFAMVCAACSGEGAGTDGGGETIGLAITSPAPGAQFERATLDDVGALVATVPLEVTVDGTPTRVAISIAGTEIDEVSAEGTATATLAAAGPVTLVARAFDADGAVVASAEVAIVVVEAAAAADCHAWLDLYQVQYTVGPTRMGVTDPVTATMPLNGIAFRTSSAARTTMFGDCTLIRSLATAASMWRKRGIVEVTDLGIYNYRCINSDGTPPNCTIGLSEHSFGNAIDLALFKDSMGETYSVNDDWVIDPDAEKTCEAPTVAGKDRFLHEMICELKNAKVWNIVLTPNYNSLHRNHFHVDLTAGSNFITRTVLDEGDHGFADAHDH